MIRIKKNNSTTLHNKYYCQGESCKHCSYIASITVLEGIFKDPLEPPEGYNQSKLRLSDGLSNFLSN